MANTNAVWGIDIGQCALKALQCTLDDDGETIVADKFDFIEYPKILSQPEADPEELVKEALEQFLARNEVVGDRVAICVSGQAGLSRFFKPPPVEAKTMPDIVKYEVKQQIPFPIEDVIWDWQQLGGSIVDGRAIDAEVGLFAMKREAVFRALRPFDDVDVEIDVVQLSPLSIFNVICFDQIEELPDPEDFDPENPPESTVVMSMGTDTTDLIVTNGIKLWLRNIPIGGNHFTKQLSREMKLTQAKAEHLKRNARVSENPKAIFKAMRPVFSDLVNEVQRSLTFFQSMEKSANLSEIVLLGNAAKLPGLRQFLSKQLEIDIAKISEFKKLQGSEVVSQPTFSSNLLSFAPCYGLCIQGLKKGKIKTNLLPEEIVVERIVRAKKPWVLASVGALLVGLVLGLFFKTNAWWRVNPAFTDAASVTWDSAINKVTDKKTKSDTFKTADTELKTNLDKLKTIAQELVSASEGKSTWLEFYSAMTQAFPKDDRIEKLVAESGGKIDPNDVHFEDRKELYVDHVESVYYKDLQAWFSLIEPIHKRMFIKSEEEINAAKALGADTDSALQELGEMASEEATGAFAGVSGWVIEIKGHHFHNSDKQLSALDSGKAYLVRTLVKQLIEKKDVKLPVSDVNESDLFSFADIGISYPTITVTSERKAKQIMFDPANAEDEEEGGGGGSRGGITGADGGGLGMGLPAGPGGPGGGDSDGREPGTNETESTNVVFPVYEYNFVVQIAWTPRSEKERLEAREARLKADADAEAAAKEAADLAAGEAATE